MAIIYVYRQLATICQYCNCRNLICCCYRLSGFSRVPPSQTCWWRGTHWWSTCTPRSRSTAGRSTGWSTRWWTWGGGSGMRWQTSTWPLLSVWMNSEDVRSTAWGQTSFILVHKSELHKAFWIIYETGYETLLNFFNDFNFLWQCKLGLYWNLRKCNDKIM